MKRVEAIAYDPTNPMFVYAGTFGTGIFRSVDGGLTWEPTEIQGLEVGTIAVEPFAPSRVVAGVGNAGEWNLGLSTDHSVSWQPLPKTLEGLYRLLYSAENPPVLSAGTFYGLYRSLDHGYTWSRAAGDLGYASISSLATTTAGERVILSTGTHGGIIPSAIPQTHDDTQQSLIEAGVYRLTNLLPNWRIYLPVVAMGGGL